MRDSWDACGTNVQALILAFDQIMEHDEAEREAQSHRAGKPAGPRPKPSKGRKKSR